MPKPQAETILTTLNGKGLSAFHSLHCGPVQNGIPRSGQNHDLIRLAFTVQAETNLYFTFNASSTGTGGIKLVRLQRSSYKLTSVSQVASMGVDQMAGLAM
jgi:hypothetical protein